MICKTEDLAIAQTVSLLDDLLPPENGSIHVIILDFQWPLTFPVPRTYICHYLGHEIGI